MVKLLYHNKGGVIMLWLDLIDILFLLIGICLGYIICAGIHRDLFNDECESCEYREIIEGFLNDERE